MREHKRKCFMCGTSPNDDTAITLHRFPKPGSKNYLRCELWAKFCFPDGKWSSPDFQMKLYNEHRMLCHKHFNEPSYVNFTAKKLRRHAAPGENYVKIQKKPNNLPYNETTPIAQGLPSDAPGSIKTVTPSALSSPDWKIPLAMEESHKTMSLIEEGDLESHIDDADLLTCSDLEVEYLEALSEEEIESSIAEEAALVDEASNTEKSNIINDANLLIYDTKNLSIKNIICATCLSSGRTLYPLVEKKYFSMVQQLCSDVQFTEEDMICWECDALINKMWKFKHQVVLAQSRFREFTTQGDKVIITKTLSSMETTEITHLSIFSNYTSEVDREGELNTPENNSDSDYIEAMQPDQSDDGITLSTIPSKTSVIPNKQVTKTYYNKRKQKYNVINIPKIKEKAKLLPQPDSLKEVCKKKVMTEDEMKQFRKNMRSKWKSGEHSCHKCIITFQSAEQLNEHNKKHDPKAGNYTCRVCEQRFSDVGLRDAHYQSHFVVFECASCSMLSGSRNAMLGHFERLHGERRRMCRDCGEVFMLFQEFRQHRLVAHGPKMTCELCGKIFRERGNFSKHLKLHKNLALSEHKCQVCGMKFRWPKVLKKHLWEAHDIRENYCAVCKTEFKTLITYQKHLSSLKHMKLTNAPIENVMRQCEDCGRFFKNVARLKVHRKAYHLYEKCVCDLCNKEFISKVLLIQHLKKSNLHKTNRVRNQMCEHCGKSFYEIPTLRAHIYTHNTERSFACDVCGSAFTNPLSRYRHRRRVHNLRKVHWKNFSSSSHLPIPGETR